MQRYLLYFNYIGTKFRGVQKQTRRSSPPDSLSGSSSSNYSFETVQDALETGLSHCCQPGHPVILYPSSRTDTGVHAFCNTATVDLAPQQLLAEGRTTTTSSYHDPKRITASLNTFFLSNHIDLRL